MDEEHHSATMKVSVLPKYVVRQILITIIKMINYKHEFIFNTELFLIVFIT